VPSAFVRVVLSDRDGRLLLLRRAPDDHRFPGFWEFPGGAIDAGENACEAAARELREEVGLCPELAAWDAYGDDTAFYRADCDAADCAPTLSPEHDAWSWSPPGEEPLTPSAAWALARVAGRQSCSS
jgi:8-oxo-dGTP pyrophosphatase MutT (NUDIX family)